MESIPEVVADTLDAQAAAFAHLLGLSGDDADAAFKKAFALADGLFPHQIEGVAFLLGVRAANWPGISPHARARPVRSHSSSSCSPALP